MTEAPDPTGDPPVQRPHGWQYAAAAAIILALAALAWYLRTR